MTLIENVEQTQKNIIIKINAEFMWADKCVELVEIDISKFGITIIPTKLLMPNMLPQLLKSKKTNLTNWLINRGLIRRNHRNIFFTELVLDLESRDLYMPLILSLSTNAISLSDKYWLNPTTTTSFIANGAKIVFERKTWDDVDPFKNLYIPGELDQYGLYDCFFFEKPENLNPKSLIWSTSGIQNKRWGHDDSGYYLEKKLYKQQFEDELATLDFFALNGVMIPKYSSYIQELNDPSKEWTRFYSLGTIQEGLHVIQKRCLTGANSYLESLIDYVDNDDTIEAPIKRMCAHHNVSDNATERFIRVAKKYQSKFDIKDTFIDTSNIGLLIDENGAHPVVWGRLQRRLAWNGQFE